MDEWSFENWGSKYWADDTEVPEWRYKMNIGRKI